MTPTTRDRIAATLWTLRLSGASAARTFVRLAGFRGWHEAERRRASDERAERAASEARGQMAGWAGERGPGEVARPADGPAKGEGE